MTTPNKPTKPTAEDAYITAHILAITLVDRIRDLLQDLPAPGTEEDKINWGHVGSLGYVNAQLHEVVKFLANENG